MSRFITLNEYEQLYVQSKNKQIIIIEKMFEPEYAEKYKDKKCTSYGNDILDIGDDILDMEQKLQLLRKLGITKIEI